MAGFPAKPASIQSTTTSSALLVVSLLLFAYASLEARPALVRLRFAVPPILPEDAPQKQRIAAPAVLLAQLCAQPPPPLAAAAAAGGARTAGGGCLPAPTWQDVDELLSQPAGLHGPVTKTGLPADHGTAMLHMPDLSPDCPPGLPARLSPRTTEWLNATRRMRELAAAAVGSSAGLQRLPQPRSPVPGCHFLVDHSRRVIFVGRARSPRKEAGTSSSSSSGGGGSGDARSLRSGGGSTLPSSYSSGDGGIAGAVGSGELELADLLGLAATPAQCRQQPDECERGCRGRPFCLRRLQTAAEAERLWHNYTVFGFVSNPWRRAAQAYGSLFSPGGIVQPDCSQTPFRAFAAAPGMAGQLCHDRFECCAERYGAVLQRLEPQAPSCLFTREGRPAVDFIGRAERLAEDLQELFALLNSRQQPGQPPLDVGSIPELRQEETPSLLQQYERNSLAELYLNSSALCDVRRYYADDFERLQFPSWELNWTAPVECTRSGAADALSQGRWMELRDEKCDPATPLLGSCTAKLGHQWLWDRPVCSAQYRTDAQLRQALKGRRVAILGDSHARILFTWMQHVLDGTFAKTDTFEKFYQYADWHGMAADGRRAPPAAADLHLTFSWRTTLPPITAAIRATQQSGAFPDVVVISSSSWYYVEKLPLARLESDLRELAAALADADAAARKAGKSVLWLLATAPDRVKGRSWSSSWHAPPGIITHYNAALRNSSAVHPKGPALLLDLHRLTADCLHWCSADGVHADSAVNALAIQLMVNLLQLPAGGPAPAVGPGAGPS